MKKFLSLPLLFMLSIFFSCQSLNVFNEMSGTPVLENPINGEVINITSPGMLQWNSLSGAESYDIFVNGTSLSKTVNGTSYSIETSWFGSGNSFSWKVRGINDFQMSSFSEERVVTK